ncbi:MAG: hypothetical protein Q9182_001826 [Xanthomendoza sp. 2 TL-2023]
MEILPSKMSDKEQRHVQEAHEIEARQTNKHARPWEAFDGNMMMPRALNQTKSSTTLPQKKRARSPGPEEEAHGLPTKLLVTEQTIMVSQASHPTTDSDQIREAQHASLRETDTGLEYKHRYHGWIPAVRHDTIRRQLIDDAKQRGDYVFVWGEGLDKEDQTSFHPDYECWDIRAEDHNPVASLLHDQPHKTKDKAGDWYDNARIVIGSRGTPVLQWNHLPATISHKIRGIELLGLLLVNQRATTGDIVDRMPSVVKISNKAWEKLPGIDRFDMRWKSAYYRLLKKEKLIEKGAKRAGSDNDGEQEPSGDGTSKAATKASTEPLDHQVAELYAQKSKDDWRFRAPENEAEEKELQLALRETRQAFKTRLGGRRDAPEPCHTRHYAAQWKFIRAEFVAQWERVLSVQPPPLWLYERGEGSGIKTWRVGNRVQDEDLADEFNCDPQDSAPSTSGTDQDSSGEDEEGAN